MTPKMIWSTLGCLVFVATVISNYFVDIPEAVIVVLIGLWSLCFAATIKVENPPREKDIMAEIQQDVKRKMPKAKFQWPDGFSDWKEADRDWYVRQMELSGWVFDEGDKVPVKNDIGPSFPWPDVQEARANIDRAGRQKNCKHLDKTEITELGDRHRKFYCMICEKILED
jgi:hypothetical protein